ncbi:MAG: FMN-binding protein [bacterium]
MSSKKINSFLFALIMCVIVSVLLSLAANGLKERQELNIKIDKQKNILKALGLIKGGQKLKNEAVVQLYSKNVKNTYLDMKTGEVKSTVFEGALPLFIIEINNRIEKYAIPFKAYGLWSWIHGIIALEGDGKTVVGLTVFKHGETPGLGGEVEKEWFQKQFQRKQIVNKENQFTSIQIAKGKAKDTYKKSELSYSIDGMSGATITSKGLERDLKAELKKYDILSKKLRER